MLKIQEQLNNTITEIVKSRNNDSIEGMLDEYIVESLMEYLKNHKEFYVYDETLVYADYPRNFLGLYKRSTKQVIVNIFYAKDISRRIVNLGYTRLIEHFVLTMLHEHRHAWQWFNNDETTKTPLVDSKKDYKGYWEHPMEVDARNTSEKYMAEAMEYLVNKLRSSYLNK